MLDGEKNLIKSAIEGEASAFGLLYDHYLPKIYRFIYFKVSHREEAEDLTHQVFLKAWQNIKFYTPTENPFSSWLYRIARNQVIDFYRKKRPITSIDDINTDLFVAPSDPDPDLKINMARIKKAMRKLTEEQQDVVIMKYIEDLTAKEIAKTLEKSEGAIRLLQHRALAKLKKTIKENERFN